METKKRFPLIVIQNDVKKTKGVQNVASQPGMVQSQDSEGPV